MIAAEHPFQFVTASYITRIGNDKAMTLAELAEGLDGSATPPFFTTLFKASAVTTF